MKKFALLALVALGLSACASETPYQHAAEMQRIYNLPVVYPGDANFNYYVSDKTVKKRRETISNDMLNCPNVKDNEAQRVCWENMETAMASGPSEPKNTVSVDEDSPVVMMHEAHHIMNEIENRLNY